MKSVRLVHLVLVLAAVSLARVDLAVASAGFDLFETDPESTEFKFEGPTELPANFFGRGSDPFSGSVKFGGIPLGTFKGKRIGDADTVIRREGGARSGTAKIKLVKLSLESVKPITVTFGATGKGATRSNGGVSKELWAVKATPSMKLPSLGKISIGSSGTFSSQLSVVPGLAFTRIPDGKRLTIDLGRFGPPIAEALTFQQQGGAWRKGCVLPALAVRGLNDGFCAGFTPSGEKTLTVEEARTAKHGVYPAQPLLEHFECYRVSRSTFAARSVFLVDRFGGRRAQISHRAELCDPVQKNDEKVKNQEAHLQCYTTDGSPVRRTVVAQNQLGSQRLLVKSPQRLCVPSEKRIVRIGKPTSLAPIETPIDHFQCYAVEPKSSLWTLNPIRGVRLTDQLGERGAKIGQPFQLCAPAEKRSNGKVTPIENPVKHLVCYRIGPKPVARQIEIRNQFERHKEAVKESNSLCVPSDATLEG